jgi:hypothetical protein
MAERGIVSDERTEAEPRDRPEVSTTAADDARADPRRAGPVGRRQSRPLIERLGLAAIAMVLALLFAGVAAASWVGNEPFLAAMAAIGSLMTLWVGTLTLLRG